MIAPHRPPGNRLAAPCALALTACLLAGAAGCARDRPLRIDLPPHVHRPSPAAVVLFVDGLGRDTFEAALAEGLLPHVERHLVSRGVRVERAVASIPSITYANAVTLLTGLFPAHHGIMANTWFDPEQRLARDYCLIATYQLVDSDYTSPTLHDLLEGEDSTSFQAAQRRGATYSIDNWATSGINWFFGNYTGVDCLVAQNLELVAGHAARRGRWPALIFAYFPGVDQVGHRHGPRSAEYRAALKNADLQIGHICEGLKQAEMYNSTCLVLISDHGLLPASRDRILDVADFISANRGRRATSSQRLAAGEDSADTAEAVVSVTGSRWCSVHVRGDSGWGGTFHAAYGESPELEPWIEGPRGRLLDHEAVELAAGRHSEDAVWLRSRSGLALVHRRRHEGRNQYRYEAVSRDPLGYRADPALREFAAAGWHDSRQWLERTVAHRYPDLIPQIVELFDSPRAGDIVLFAAEDWGFADEAAGGHGSILAEEMLVPMILAGAGLPAGETIPAARNADLMPTLAELLGVSHRLPAGAELDGVSLLPQCLPADRIAAP